MCMIKTQFRGWVQLGDGKVCSNANDVQGVFCPENIEDVRERVGSRVDRFLQANSIGNNLAKQEFFSGDSFNEPLFGAYGERL